MLLLCVVSMTNFGWWPSPTSAKSSLKVRTKIRICGDLIHLKSWIKLCKVLWPNRITVLQKYATWNIVLGRTMCGRYGYAIGRKNLLKVMIVSTFNLLTFIILSTARLSVAILLVPLLAIRSAVCVMHIIILNLQAFGIRGKVNGMIHVRFLPPAMMLSFSWRITVWLVRCMT